MLSFGDWNLDIGDCLVIGAWNLVIVSLNNAILIVLRR